MADLPTIRDLDSLVSTLETWRQRLNANLPNEREYIGYPGNTWFDKIDTRTIRFRFDPARNATAHDVEWSDKPDFETKKSNRIHTDALDVEVQVPGTYACGTKLYFRVRGVRGNYQGRWSPIAKVTVACPPSILSFVTITGEAYPDGPDGLFKINTVRFPDEDAVKFVTHLVFTMYHVSEIEDATTALTDAVDAETTTFTFDDDASVAKDTYYYIDREIIKVTDDPAASTREVVRGALGSTAAVHDAAEPVYRIDISYLVQHFPQGAFEAGGVGLGWEGTIHLESQLVVACSGTAVNEKAESDAVVQYYGGTGNTWPDEDKGKRVLTGRILLMFAPGTVSVADNVVPPGGTIDRDTSYRDFYVETQTAVTSDTVFRFNQNGTALGTVTILNGATKSDFLDGKGLGWLAKEDKLTLDVVSGGGGTHIRGNVRF